MRKFKVGDYIRMLDNEKVTGYIFNTDRYPQVLVELDLGVTGWDIKVESYQYPGTPITNSGHGWWANKDGIELIYKKARTPKGKALTEAIQACREAITNINKEVEC